MIQKEDFFQIYNENLFVETSDELTLREKDDAFIKATTLVLKDANFVYSTESVWKSSEDLFKKQTPTHYCNFRLKTDGFVFCTYHETNYLIWIELKSSFDQIFNKAIYQLCACYTKAKILLNTFSDYKSSDYKEFCIVVSKPEGSKERSVDGNSVVTSRRDHLTSLLSSIAERRCRESYRKTGKIVLDCDDFNLQNTAICDSFLPHNIPVVHISSTISEPIVDLGSVIKGL